MDTKQSIDVKKIIIVTTDGKEHRFDNVRVFSIDTAKNCFVIFNNRNNRIMFPTHNVFYTVEE